MGSGPLVPTYYTLYSALKSAKSVAVPGIKLKFNNTYATLREIKNSLITAAAGIQLQQTHPLISPHGKGHRRVADERLRHSCRLCQVQNSQTLHPNRKQKRSTKKHQGRSSNYFFRDIDNQRTITGNKLIWYGSIN